MKNFVTLTLAFIAFTACNDKPEVLPPGYTLTVYPNQVLRHATISIQNPEGSPFHLVAFDARGEGFAGKKGKR